MPTYLTPDVYIEEVPSNARSIEGVGTSTAAFVGVAPKAEAHVNKAYPLSNWSQFVREFVADDSTSTDLANAVYGFFNNGGKRCYVVNIGEKARSITGTGRTRQGLAVLEEVDEVAIVAAPGYSDAASHEALISHAELLRDRVAILDPPAAVDDIQLLKKVAGGDAPEPAGTATTAAATSAPASGLRPRETAFAAYYYPRIEVLDALNGAKVLVPPSGHLAGVWARVDGTRGVHKAPANEAIRGAVGLAAQLTPADQAELNPLGINCIRFFTTQGVLVWGARTLANKSSEWRYLNVRRLVSMIEESIAESTRWIVFEPNAPELWRSIERDVTAFLTRLWRDGALVGRTAADAFYVLCNDETNPPESVDAGEVVTVIGLAVSKPAEFVVFRLTQVASGSQIDAEGGSGA